MRNQIVLLTLTSLFAACSTTGYVQVVDVQSTLPVQQNNYVYDDGLCRITYALWAEGGNAGFMVENLTEEIMYLDLAKSFFVQNGTAHDYYLHRSFNRGSSASSSNAFAQGAMALVLGTSGGICEHKHKRHFLQYDHLGEKHRGHSSARQQKHI